MLGSNLEQLKSFLAILFRKWAKASVSTLKLEVVAANVKLLIKLVTDVDANLVYRFVVAVRIWSSVFKCFVVLEQLANCLIANSLK